jgi:SAM-dependent methyltransferase
MNASISSEKCPSCDSESTVIGRSRGASVNRCVMCDLWFLDQSIRANTVNDNSWYGDMPLDAKANAESFVNVMNSRYRNQLRCLGQLSSGRRIADIGCGIGVFLAVAKRNGWNAIGIEASQHAAARAKKYYDVDILDSLSKVKDESFDVVRLSHVLEHVSEPQLFLSEVRRILAPGGIIHVLVPNRESLSSYLVNTIRRWRNSCPNLSTAVYPDMHVLGFSHLSLIEVLSKRGFTSVNLFGASMGDRSYIPIFYDGLLNQVPFRSISRKQLLRFWLPQFFDNLGNPFSRGSWIVGFFRK